MRFRRSVLVPLTLALMLAACVTERERPENAATDKQRAEIHTQLGASYLARNQLEVAQQELERALALDSGDSQANNVMGLLQIRLKNDSKAETHFKRAISGNPDNSEARNNFGAFLCERNRFDEAERQFRAAAENPLYKTPELAKLNAGVCLMRKPAPQQAVPYFKEALELNPKLAQALLYMARISYDSGKTLSARGFMQRYMEVAKDSPESLMLAIRIEHTLKAQDTVASLSLRLRGKFPDSLEAKQLSQVLKK